MAYWGPYSVSKAAVELMARIYAAETATTKLRVNLFNPGPIRTRMRATAMPGEDPMTLDTPENCAEKIVDLCLPGYARDRHALQLSRQEIPQLDAAGLSHVLTNWPGLNQSHKPLWRAHGATHHRTATRRIGNAQAWRDTFREQIPELPIRISA